MVAFIIWTIVSLIFLLIAVSSWKKDTPVGFFNVVDPPEIPAQNITAYNHAVAKIWTFFAIVFEVIGIPLLFAGQNSPIVVLLLPAVIALIITIIVIYLRVEIKYRQTKAE